MNRLLKQGAAKLRATLKKLAKRPPQDGQSLTAPNFVRNSEISAVVIRADGTVEDLGVISSMKG